MRRADRISTILERLATDRRLNASDLALELDVSAATLRRDLQLLEDQRLLSRTHGGAIAHDVAYELPVRYRGGRNRDAKQQIARKAAELLPCGLLTMGLTGGTTTSEVGRIISSRVDLTVVTNALNIAADLALRPRLKLILTGGVTRSQSYELVGAFAEQTLAALHLEVAVVGVDGIDASAGLTTHDEVEAHTNRTMISRAKRTIVVADSSKFGVVLLAKIANIDEVHDVVTDSGAAPAHVESLQRAGVTVHLVDV